MIREQSAVIRAAPEQIECSVRHSFIAEEEKQT
jgi:hypothetical protein